MSAKKVKLADVLWEAANEHLNPNLRIYEKQFDFSCEAVGEAVGIRWDGWTAFLRNHPAIQFLRELGCKCGSGTLFDHWEDREQRQGVRYMWLLLAMHVAEDEGIEIEVEA